MLHEWGENTIVSAKLGFSEVDNEICEGNTEETVNGESFGCG